MSEKFEKIVGQIIETVGFNSKTHEYSDKIAAFSHYMNNDDLQVLKMYEADALRCLIEYSAHVIPGLNITKSQATKILVELSKNFREKVPFPPKTETQFTFIDLFAGIGGFRRALQNIGGKCVFTSEWDKYAKQVYFANYGEIPFGDITKEETKKLIPRNVDILCAGFPCQAFSIAGERGGFNDTRGTLFFDVADIIKRKKPKAFFLENVKGLVNHRSGQTLATILNVLRNDLDYEVPDPKIVNAKNFGLAQNRERIFIVGFHKSVNAFEFEIPLKSNRRNKVFADVKERSPVQAKYYLSQQYFNTLVRHRRRHESKGNGFGYQVIKESTIANAIVVGGMGRERNLVRDPNENIRGSKSTSKHELNTDSIRVMTPLEWAKLQGFCDSKNQKFLQAARKAGISDVQLYKQLGNSVAIPAIQTAATAILKAINNAR